MTDTDFDFDFDLNPDQDARTGEQKDKPANVASRNGEDENGRAGNGKPGDRPPLVNRDGPGEAEGQEGASPRRAALERPPLPSLTQPRPRGARARRRRLAQPR